MRTNKSILKYTAVIVSSIIAVFIIAFLYLYLNEYNPSTIENIYNSDVNCGLILGTNQGSDTIAEYESVERLFETGDTISFLSWNLGYAGYEQSMDFFYDGGKNVRTTKENAKRNLHGIIDILKQHRDIDVMMLQEVDIDSKRSYRMNMLDSICKAFPEFTPFYAPNYRCEFVPIPLSDPIGKVECGLVILSRYRPIVVRRHQLPNSTPFPTRTFNLKRCILEAAYPLENGDSLWISNIHNSAYDNGDMRKQEIDYIDSINTNRVYSFICGDWNSTPPGYSSSREELENEYFSPVQMSDNSIREATYMVDLNSHTMRYLYEPYIKGHTTESLIDFGVLKRGLEPVEVKTLSNHEFMFSDHNPVLYKVRITHPEAESR